MLATSKISNQLKTSLLLFFSCLTFFGFSASFSSVASGNWNNPSTWHLSGVGAIPGASDNATISSGHAITVSDNRTIGRLIVNGTSRSISINSSITLTVLGTISLASSVDLNWCSGDGFLKLAGDADRGDAGGVAGSDLGISGLSNSVGSYNTNIHLLVDLSNATDTVRIANTFVCKSIEIVKGVLKISSTSGFTSSSARNLYFNTASNGTEGSLKIGAAGRLMVSVVGRRVSGSTTEIASSFIETMQIDGVLELWNAGSGTNGGFAAKNITVNGRFVIKNNSGSAVVSSPTDAITWGTNSILEYASSTSAGFLNLGAEISRNGGVTPTIGSMIINLSGSATEIKTFSRNVNIRNELKFINGKLRFGAGNEKITLLSTATIAGADSSKFIYFDGTSSVANKGLIKLGIPVGQTFQFPVGLLNGTDYYYTPILITNHSGSTLDYEVSIALFNLQTRISGTAGATDFNELPGYQGRLNAEWNMGKVGGGTSNVDIQIKYRNLTTTGTFNHPNAQLVHYTGPNWDLPLTTTYNPTSNPVFRSVKVLNYTGSFSPFGIGDFGLVSTPLPVNLLYFKGEVLEEKGHLYWKTAQERNNAFFTIYKSTDGVHWDKISEIEGAGNSTIAQEYSFIDDHFSETAYYQLAQTDYDGTEKKWDVVALNKKENPLEIQLYPNPVQDKLSVQIVDEEFTDLELSIIDISGKKLVDLVLNVDGSVQQDVSHLPAGMYFLLIQNKNKQKTIKWMKS